MASLPLMTKRFLMKAPTWGLFLWLACGLAGASVLPKQDAVASAHPLATRAGLEILAAGGNAFDAAVTVSAVLAVVEPAGSGLGGGGFWLLHRARDGKQVMVDGREKAPLRAHRDMYLGADGKPVAGASVDGPLAAGIPGQPAALVHIAERYGRLPLSRTLAPAIRLAREGFGIDRQYRRLAAFRLDVLRASPAAASQFLLEGEVPPLGHRLRQPDLARTLERIARHGWAGFYQGATARRLVRGVRDAGGIWTLHDLAGYRVVERAPIVGHIGTYRVVSAALPSSGGILLAQMLNMLAGHDWQAMAKVDQTHLLVEIMRRAYYDRARYLGDSDFVNVPQRRLLDPNYARRRIADLDMRRASPSPKLNTDVEEGADTSHFSIIDRAGNRVAATLSINYPFGSGFVADGTGVLLNDEMDDFSIQPGVPNVYGLVGNQANAIAPGKRMLSSMSPTFVEGLDRVAVLGSPGGSRIITTVLLALLDFVEGGDAASMARRYRFHHQYLPNRIDYEPELFTATELARLRERGHELKATDWRWGNLQIVTWDRRSGRAQAASDPRYGGLGATR